MSTDKAKDFFVLQIFTIVIFYIHKLPIVKKEANIINVIVYYPNKRFINSLKEVYSTLNFAYKLYATYDENQLKKFVELEANSVVFIPKKFNISSDVGKVVTLCEERDESGLYIYQASNSFLKSICDYTEENLDKKIVNILIPTGFNSDLHIITSVIKKLNSKGSRSLLIDTNPCRVMCESNWDYSTKEILNKNLKLSEIPYIEAGKYYYIKPFNSFKDYYLNCEVYGKLLANLKELEGIDYIFFLHYLSDYSSLNEIEKHSKLNIMLTYGTDMEANIAELDIKDVYSSKLLELLDDDYAVSKNTVLASSENIWTSTKVYYREFELSLFEELVRC